MMRYIREEQISSILPTRKPDAHKGSFGRLLMIAGSVGMAGAAVLSARGALRSGVGTVTICADREIFPILQTAVPEAMCRERNEDMDFSSYSAVVVGPGIGCFTGDGSLMKKLLMEYKGPMVIDADGLNNIVRFDLSAHVKDTQAKIIITPHPGEGARLLGSEELDDRRDAVVALSRKYRCVTILKGHETLIAEAGGDIWQNNTGNPGMATGGSGDVLAGVVGALVAQGCCPLDGAMVGTYIHGLAGDLCREQYGEISMTAGDIIQYIPTAFQEILVNSGGNNGNQ